MLRERLNRRDSIRDTFWEGRVQAGRGETEQAQASLNQAAQAWQGADQDVPEMKALNHMIESA